MSIDLDEVFAEECDQLAEMLRDMSGIVVED
jgi:hypothetical protein